MIIDNNIMAYKSRDFFAVLIIHIYNIVTKQQFFLWKTWVKSYSDIVGIAFSSILISYTLVCGGLRVVSFIDLLCPEGAIIDGLAFVQHSIADVVNIVDGFGLHVAPE